MIHKSTPDGKVAIHKSLDEKPVKVVDSEAQAIDFCKNLIANPAKKRPKPIDPGPSLVPAKLPKGEPKETL